MTDATQFPPALRLTATYPATDRLSSADLRRLYPTGAGTGPETVELVWEFGAGIPDVAGVAKLIEALHNRPRPPLASGGVVTRVTMPDVVGGADFGDFLKNEIRKTSPGYSPPKTAPDRGDDEGTAGVAAVVR